MKYEKLMLEISEVMDELIKIGFDKCFFFDGLSYIISDGKERKFCTVNFNVFEGIDIKDDIRRSRKFITFKSANWKDELFIAVNEIINNATLHKFSYWRRFTSLFKTNRTILNLTKTNSANDTTPMVENQLKRSDLQLLVERGRVYDELIRLKFTNDDFRYFEYQYKSLKNYLSIYFNYSHCEFWNFGNNQSEEFKYEPGWDVRLLQKVRADFEKYITDVN
ncbi:MAG: hypothetical protein EKK54_06120 [Neisseriaceae bacterium]|nr:MAG: hypothetical protein EKK54_06120 [Neisseriaceae bacterium]